MTDFRKRTTFCLPSIANRPGESARFHFNAEPQALAARSPMMTHGAMVLPLTIRGIIDASAIRRFFRPAHLLSCVRPGIKDPAANLFVESLFNGAAARILCNYAEVRYPLSGPPRLTDDQVRAAIDCIQDHVGDALDLSSISRVAGLSEFHFARLFKAATGVTPFQFVTQARMARAKELLRKTRLPISEIAERVGYQKPNHFSHRFRDASGCGPDAYRKSVAANRRSCVFCDISNAVHYELGARIRS